MPYAAEGQISTSPIPGGVKITDQQYQQALDGILQGQVVSVDGGFTVADPPPPPEPEPEPEPTLEEKRESASIDRVDFLLGLVDLGVITEATADEASDGTWPSTFDPFLASLPLKDRMEVKSKWRTADRVQYNSPVLATVAAYTQTEEALQTVTEAQLDTLFGVTS